MAPQIIYLVLIFLGLCIAVRDHGKVDPKPKDGVTSVISAAIVLTLLYWGDFFDPLFR